MKYLLSLVIIFGTFASSAQAEDGRKGSLYFYWGWNRCHFSSSDISFTGEGYAFTLHDVIADDRPSPFEPKVYLNPKWMTIPQYNFRFGYFINENWDLSFGIDHMKYVARYGQEVDATGFIDIGSHADGIYDQTPVNLYSSFLEFEHTDGLNCINLEARRHTSSIQRGIFAFHLMTGGGIGALLPKTNSQLLKKERNDEFHLSGYALTVMGGIQVQIGKHFFVQSELKGGWINMPDIVTSPDPVDRAKQHFFFDQINIVFGMNFN